MTYTPFLIANFATGFDKELQPWLLPNDAFTQLTDGYVYRGVVNKRDGYNGYAIGEDSTYCESRMVHKVTAEAYGTGDGSAGPYTHTAANLPLRRGTTTITAGAQSATDNSNGVFVTTPAGGTGTINYTTGQMSVTFNAAVAGAVPITVTYSYHQGLPVMGVMSFYPKNNVRELLVVDTKYVNKYDPATDRLIDVSPASAYNGDNSDFWGWVNYAAANSDPRLLFCNRVNGDVIQQWNGTTVTAYAPTFAVGTLNARQMFNFSGRLVLFQTWENGVFYPKRIRISGTGANCDVFDLTATGAGLIDIDDNTQFFGAIQNRNDLLVFTEGSTWVLKFSGNDVAPFQLQRIDNSRGSSAAFSVISYLNRTMAASPRGLILCDGYQVERMDANIPRFSFDDINSKYFNRCFSAFLDEDRDVYMMYPSVNVERPILVNENASDEILVTNFEEDNFCVYQIPLSCMGNFIETIAKQWQDLTAVQGFPDWNALAAKYNNWNAFPFTVGAPISIGGGHKGEIWSLNNTQGQDNPQPIRGITIVSKYVIQVTTDWNNYELGDSIFFDGVGGMTEINRRQGVIKSISTAYNVFTVEFIQKSIGEDGIVNAYTSGGMASRCIPLIATSKKLNPWINSDKKVRCGWMYFYVSVLGTPLLHKGPDEDGNEIDIADNAIINVSVLVGNNEESDFSATQFNYEVNCTNINEEIGKKKWVKIWINQVGQFLQFQMKNNQASTNVQIHAMMCGFQPLGRLV